MLERINLLILLGQVLHIIPLTGLEVLQPVVVLELLPQYVIHCILNLVLELHLVVLTHLHLDSLCTFVIFVAHDALFIKRFLHLLVGLHVLEILIFLFNLQVGLLLFIFKFQSFKS